MTLREEIRGILKIYLIDLVWGLSRSKLKWTRVPTKQLKTLEDLIMGAVNDRKTK